MEMIRGIRIERGRRKKSSEDLRKKIVQRPVTCGECMKISIIGKATDGRRVNREDLRHEKDSSVTHDVAK